MSIPSGSIEALCEDSINTHTKTESAHVAAARKPSNAQIDARRIAATPRGVAIGFPIYAKRYQNAGLLLLTCCVHGTVIRFLFPLTIEGAIFEEGMTILSKALSA